MILRTRVAEKLADALMLPLSIGEKKVTGEITVPLDFGAGFTLPFTLTVVGQFGSGDDKDSRDGGLLLRGPCDLYCFVGYGHTEDVTVFALIDRSRVGHPLARVMHTAYLSVARSRLEESGALVGLWTRHATDAKWVEDVEEVA